MALLLSNNSFFRLSNNCKLLLSSDESGAEDKDLVIFEKSIINRLDAYNSLYASKQEIFLGLMPSSDASSKFMDLITGFVYQTADNPTGTDKVSIGDSLSRTWANVGFVLYLNDKSRRKDFLNIVSEFREFLYKNYPEAFSLSMDSGYLEQGQRGFIEYTLKFKLDKYLKEGN